MSHPQYDEGTSEPPASHARPVAAPLGYRIVAKIGAGAVGTVYRAEDVLLGRQVALKVLDPCRARDRVLVQQFQKEARALAQLRHGNVVQVYAFGEEAGGQYLIMELVSGKTLDDLIEEAKATGAVVPRDRAAGFIRGIAAGLGAVHDARLVHRDLKPGNVMVETSTDRPVLIDFGLARRRVGSCDQLSIFGGTPLYMAPEQARAGEASVQSDIYALACTAFELLTGHCVFEGGNIYEVMQAHLTTPARSPSSLCAELAPLDPVFERALRKDPNERFGSVAEFIAAFELAIGHVLVPAKRSSGINRRTTLRMTHQRYVVLTAAMSTERALARIVRAVDAECTIENAVTVEAARDALASGGILIADEDSIPSIAALIDAMQGRAHAIVVASRREGVIAGQHREFGVHVLPKPLNIHLSRAILKRAVDGR